MRTLSILAILVLGAIGNAFAQVPTGGLTNGLLAYYPLRSNSVNQVDTNSKLFENNIQYRVTGGQMSASFNGQDSYLKSTNDLAITGTQSRTFSAWIYTTNATAGGVIAKWGLLDRYGNIFPENAGFGQLWSLYVGYTDKTAFVNADYRIYGPPLNGAVNLVINTWQQIVYSFDQSNDQLTIYINNVPVSCTTQPLPPFTPPLNTALGPLYLGSQAPIPNNGDGWFNHWWGSMQKVGIWNRALTAAEVLALYNLQRPVYEVTLTTKSSTNLNEWTSILTNKVETYNPFEFYKNELSVTIKEPTQ